MDSDYSKAALMRFLNEVVVSQGLLKPNTAAGWSVACTRILEDLGEKDDVRKVDVPTAMKRYHNKHPGELKGTVLKEYERRLNYALADFVQFTEDPTKYKGRGRGPSSNREGAQAARKGKTPTNQTVTPLTGALAFEGVQPKVSVIAGLSLEFPMRTDFLAQVVVPRDMKADEARRLARFVMALAVDNEVKAGEF